MLIIPVTSVAAQTLNVVLGGQSCTINLYQKRDVMLCDLLVGATTVMSAVVCHDRVKLVRYPYLGFVGDLVFIDMQGTSDPDYTELGTRYIFCYLEASDL
jgi:hypothetical protein